MIACTNHPSVIENVYSCSRCARPFCTDCLVTLQGRRYCAQCKAEQLIDVRSGVDTTQIPLAGIGRRFAAIVIDGFVLGVPMMIVMFVVMIPMFMTNSNRPPPPWLFWIGWGLAPVYIIYEGLMLQLRGQTLGKMALRIKVVRPNGQPISAGQAWGRAVVRALFVSLLAIVNYAPALFTQEKTCIHDMAAGTRVVLID